MNRPALILCGILALAAAPLARAQQINPRNPPPPPPAEPASPAAPSDPASSASHSSSPAPPAPAKSADDKLPGAKPIDPTVPPPPPLADEPEEEAAPAPSGPSFDPLHAQRSLDVGTFYLKKGSYDAAIDRFIEASNYQPSLAAPWRMLGEAYEKKHESHKAIEAYNKYLQILPHAADAARIKKTIADLEEKSAPNSSKQ